MLAPGKGSEQRQAAHSILRPFTGVQIHLMWTNLSALHETGFPLFHLLPFLQDRKMDTCFCRKDLLRMKQPIVVLQIWAVKETWTA